MEPCHAVEIRGGGTWGGALPHGIGWPGLLQNPMLARLRTPAERHPSQGTFGEIQGVYRDAPSSKRPKCLGKEKKEEKRREEKRREEKRREEKRREEKRREEIETPEQQPNPRARARRLG